METGTSTGNKSKKVTLKRKIKEFVDDDYKIFGTEKQFSPKNYIDIKKGDLELILFLQRLTKIPFKICTVEDNEQFCLMTNEGELVRIEEFNTNSDMLKSLSSYELSYWQFVPLPDKQYCYDIYDEKEKIGSLETNEELCL